MLSQNLMSWKYETRDTISYFQIPYNPGVCAESDFSWQFINRIMPKPCRPPAFVQYIVTASTGLTDAENKPSRIKKLEKGFLVLLKTFLSVAICLDDVLDHLVK